jgi:hypothetical protein
MLMLAQHFQPDPSRIICVNLTLRDPHEIYKKISMMWLKKPA